MSARSRSAPARGRPDTSSIRPPPVLSTTTSPANTSIVLGSSTTDSATVSGTAAVGSPSGTVSFYECGPTPGPTSCSSISNQVGERGQPQRGAGQHVHGDLGILHSPVRWYLVLRRPLLRGLQLRLQLRHQHLGVRHGHSGHTVNPLDQQPSSFRNVTEEGPRRLPSARMATG